MERIQMTHCPNCGSRATRRSQKNAFESRHSYSCGGEKLVQCLDCDYLERFLSGLPTAQPSNEELFSSEEEDVQHQLEKDSFSHLSADWKCSEGIGLETLFLGGSTVRIPTIPAQ